MTEDTSSKDSMMIAERATYFLAGLLLLPVTSYVAYVMWKSLSHVDGSSGYTAFGLAVFGFICCGPLMSIALLGLKIEWCFLADGTLRISHTSWGIPLRTKDWNLEDPICFDIGHSPGRPFRQIRITTRDESKRGIYIGTFSSEEEALGCKKELETFYSESSR